MAPNCARNSADKALSESSLSLGEDACRLDSGLLDARSMPATNASLAILRVSLTVVKNCGLIITLARREDGPSADGSASLVVKCGIVKARAAVPG